CCGRPLRSLSFPYATLFRSGSALFYANRGWAVFPCVPAKYDGEGGKSPRIKDWQNLATIDREQIIDWWTRMPSSNVGVICGARSDRKSTRLNSSHVKISYAV